jgi:F-type H+-transporting ATPase subunit b
MKRLAMILLLAAAPLTIAAAPQSAEHETSKAGEAPAEGEHEGLGVWKWANFAVLAGVLGWAVKKNAGPFFAARSRQIRKDMLEAGDLQRDAEARAAEIGRRLANLEVEIAALRSDSAREAESDKARLSHFTTAEIAKVQAHAEQEIASAGKAARTELKRYSAELAIRLAEEKLRARMTPQTQEALVKGFVRHLEPAGTSADPKRTS